MSKKANVWIVIMAILAIGVSMYPISYLPIGSKYGLLNSKSDALLADTFWNIGFYLHIIFGGFALLVGWFQFVPKWRNTNIKRHKVVGYSYAVSVLLSGLGGLYIAQFATGGWIPRVGFTLLAVFWLASSILAIQTVRRQEIDQHKKWMIYSYSLCFAAVTLRLWLPTLIAITQDFIISYKIVSWLSWVPNLIFAWVFTKKVN